MTEKLSSELRNWFLSLGFQDKNLTATQIDEEFGRLSPPEMRDIWRSVMLHVLPLEKTRYIKKVLLLNELKNLENNSKQKTMITKNVYSIEEFRRYQNFENYSKQVNNNLEVVKHANARINEQKSQINDMENKLTDLNREKDLQNAFQTLSNGKINNYERMMNKLFETYSFLDCVNLFWQMKTVHNEKHAQTEALRDILKKINENGKDRNNSVEVSLIDEQQKLMNEITILTTDTSTSNLHKTVIYMLKDTLHTLLKLSDHVSVKHDVEIMGKFELKLIELKKQSVELFVENVRYRKQIEKLREHTQNQRIKLFTGLANNSDTESQKNFKTWVDSELLKLSMTTRLNFLQKKEVAIKNFCQNSVSVNFNGLFDKEKLFKSINDCKNHLVLLEREISNNLYHISDEPINTFINCQIYCKNKITQFIQIKQSSKHLDLGVKLTDSLKSEIQLLQKLNFNLVMRSALTSRTYSCNPYVPDYYISEFVKKCGFLLYLLHICDSMLRKIDYLLPNRNLLLEKRTEIENEEKQYSEEVRKSVSDAKNNLKSTEEYASACLNSYELWTKSANEIIPKQIITANRNFSEWQKRYVSVINCLRKQQLELNKLL